MLPLNLVQDQTSKEMPLIEERKEDGPTSSSSVDELFSCSWAVVGKKLSYV